MSIAKNEGYVRSSVMTPISIGGPKASIVGIRKNNHYLPPLEDDIAYGGGGNNVSN